LSACEIIRNPTNSFSCACFWIHGLRELSPIPAVYLKRARQFPLLHFRPFSGQGVRNAGLITRSYSFPCRRRLEEAVWLRPARHQSRSIRPTLPAPPHRPPMSAQSRRQCPLNPTANTRSIAPSMPAQSRPQSAFARTTTPVTTTTNTAPKPRIPSFWIPLPPSPRRSSTRPLCQT
jgi:hypothetical protein